MQIHYFLSCVQLQQQIIVQFWWILSTSSAQLVKGNDSQTNWNKYLGPLVLDLSWTKYKDYQTKI